ncbi:phosphotransferase [Streptomyces sp. NBC_01235]|uniref:phosphotransferase n=1 Tax=Streptomyces sp. NBC_01235 TaxID=2903788 RepID=UPI002E0E7378|nr:phosphotransferase [Streptomyces sp. NBC_01235]
MYRRLDGETATPYALADPVRTALDLAGFLTALQGADPTGGPGPQQSNAFRGVPLGDDRDSIAHESRVRPKIEALKKSRLVDTGPVTEVWEAALAAPARRKPPLWVHGDLDAGNLLLRDGRLGADGGTSRFERSRELRDDFGTLAAAGPAVDLQPAWKFLPATARAVFREAVGADDATWARARGWALAGSLPVHNDPFFRDHPARVTAAPRHLEQMVADYRADGA